MEQNQTYRIEICEQARGSASRLIHILKEKIHDAVIQNISERHLLAELSGDFRKPDILFVSISLPSTDGITLAAQIKKADPLVQIVFLANQTEDVSDIFVANPSGLLIRPFQMDKVYHALQRSITSFQKLEVSYLQLKNREHLLRIPYQKICYIESDKRYLLIHKTDGIERVRMKLSELEPHMPENFVRCHQSYLVNRNHVIQMKGLLLTLSDGNCLPVSRSHRQQTADGLLHMTNTQMRDCSDENESFHCT